MDNKSWRCLVQHNKHHHRKVLLNSFHLNGHTSGLHPQTQNVGTSLYSTTREYCSMVNRFIYSMEGLDDVKLLKVLPPGIERSKQILKN